MEAQSPMLNGVYLFVRDLEVTVAFYRRLGVSVRTFGENFARAETPGGMSIEFGTAALTASYDTGWQPPSGGSSNTLQFSLSSRQAVDDMFRELTAAGYHGHLAPIDAFWGSRFAIVDDPDGNIVGLHSPQDDSLRSPPPVK